MGTPKFDPSQLVTFDMQFGHVHLDGAPTRVMVPADALAAVCCAAGDDATRALGRAMGDAMGRRVRVRLDDEHTDVAQRQQSLRSATLDDVIEHLAGELALCGIGALSAERWGKALVLVVDQSPLERHADAAGFGDVLTASVLEGALVSAAGAEAAVVLLDRDGVRARFLAVSPAAAAIARERLAASESWGSIIAALHVGAGGPTS